MAARSPSRAKGAARPAMAGSPPPAAPALSDAGPIPNEAPVLSYPVRSPLRFDGQRFREGDTVEMTEAQAETLIALGVLGEAEPTSSAG